MFLYKLCIFVLISLFSIFLSIVIFILLFWTGGITFSIIPYDSLVLYILRILAMSNCYLERRSANSIAVNGWIFYCIWKCFNFVFGGKFNFSCCFIPKFLFWGGCWVGLTYKIFFFGAFKLFGTLSSLSSASLLFAGD